MKKGPGNQGLSFRGLGRSGCPRGHQSGINNANPVPGFPLVVMAYIIGALGGRFPCRPASARSEAWSGCPSSTAWTQRNAALAAVLLYQAIGLLVPLAGGGIAYTILRRNPGQMPARVSEGSG
jgi:uncharacterized membrane protein YbhN (UPF0104 family)